MLRPRRAAQLPIRYRESSPPRSLEDNNQRKRRRIDPAVVDQNDVDQALTVITLASESTVKPPILILTELPHFAANYVLNQTAVP